MSIIPNGTNAKEFRNRVEDKNTLATKGTLYAGTGTATDEGYTKTVSTPPRRKIKF